MACRKALTKNCSTKYVSFAPSLLRNWRRQLKTTPWRLFLNFSQQKFISMRHLEISSVLLFSKLSRSAQMKETFSDKKRSQRFEPHWYGEAFLWRPWSFTFHTCFDSSVSFMHSRCLKDFVWLLYRDLNSPSEVP